MRYDRTSQRRTNDTGAIDQSRIEGNGTGEIIFSDDFLQKCLPRWHLEGLQHARHERQGKDLPDIDPATQNERAQGERLEHEQHLSMKANAITIETVGNNAS